MQAKLSAVEIVLRAKERELAIKERNSPPSLSERTRGGVLLLKPSSKRCGPSSTSRRPLKRRKGPRRG